MDGSTGTSRTMGRGSHLEGGVHPAIGINCLPCPIFTRPVYVHRTPTESRMTTRYTVTVYRDYDGKIKVARTPRN